MVTENYFDGMSGAKVYKRLPNTQPGKYLVEIDACKISDTRSGVFFIVEMDIVESDNPERAAGTKMSWMVKRKDEFEETFLSNVKDFIMGVTGLDENKITDETAMKIIAPDQPLSGVRARLTAYQSTLKNGNEFTRTIWEAVDDEDEE